MNNQEPANVTTKNKFFALRNEASEVLFYFLIKAAKSALLDQSSAADVT